MKYIKRIIGLPFFLVLALIGCIQGLFIISKNFLLYGGEYIVYTRKDYKETICSKLDKLIEDK